MKTLKLTVYGLAAFAVLLVSGCAREPNIVDVKPSETAFAVPVKGATSKQEKFESETFLKKNQVPGKRVTIYYQKEKWGLGPQQYNWVPDQRIYLVDRMPVSRQWVDVSDAKTNEDGFAAESKESIAFVARVSVVAEITEQDAAKYLYFHGTTSGEKDNPYLYRARPLTDVLDVDVKIKAAGRFSEECAKYPLRELVTKKKEIMDAVRNAYIPYFKSRGITITALALQGDFHYKNRAVQDAFNRQFTTEQEALAQANASLRSLEKARTDVKVANLVAKSRDILVLRRLDNDRYRLETDRLRWNRWNGNLAPHVGYYTPGSLTGPEAPPASAPPAPVVAPPANNAPVGDEAATSGGINESADETQ